MHFEQLFVYPNGRTSRAEFVPAMITLLAVILFYALLVTGLTAKWCLVVILYPALVLHARRLQDMGRSAWLLIVPAVLMIVAFAIWLDGLDLGAQLNRAVPLIALAVAAGFAVWGSFGKQR